MGTESHRGRQGLRTYAASLLPLSARWEEEYTVRMQLQQRVNELQEVRVPHRPCFSQSPRSPFGPGAGSLSRLILTFLPHQQCH